MTFNATNRKDIRAREKAQLLATIIRGEVISGIMSVQNGRQWMHELLAATFVFTDPFSPDPYIHAANSGQRSIGIQLFADIMAFCPKNFTIMIEEHHVRSAAADERSSSPKPDGRDKAAGFDDDPTPDRVDHEYEPRDEVAGGEAGSQA